MMLRGTVRTGRSIASWLAILIATGGLVRAQTSSVAVDKARDQMESVLESRAPEAAPEEETPPSGEAAIAVDKEKEFDIAIRAIRVVSHQDKIDPEADPGDLADPIRIDSELHPPKNLTAILSPYLGQKISIAKLERLAKEIVQAYRETNYPVVDPYIPEQNITGGKLQIVIREAVLGEVTVEGAKWSRPQYLIRQIRMARGERINSRILHADLDWLNENPTRQVDLIYEKGEAEGTADIVLRTEEVKPWTVYAGFANSGIELTGENEWSAGFTHANLFGSEHLVGYNYNTDYELDHLKAHTLFYRIPLPWRHKINLIGAYVESDAIDDGALFDLTGEEIQGTGEYAIPLPRISRKWKHDFTAGADFKSTNTNLFAGGAELFDAEVVVLQGRAQYHTTLVDKWGATEVTVGTAISPGDVLAGNSDSNFEFQRWGASADYVYGFVEAERVFRLPGEFVFQLEGTAQFTDAALIATEQLLAGGYRTVRGYDESLVRGDSGAIVRATLFSPPFSLLGPVIEGLDDRANLLAFYDGAFLTVNHSEIGAPNPSIQSVGLGLNYWIAERAQARVAYGWDIATQGLLEEIPSGKVHFGVTVSY
jgi:hemolysin activation/secretion protein